MTGRTPSFIVVGLVIIMFLLGFFYMSCSSKNTELRLSLEDFEVRIRALTLKNSEAEKKIDTLISRKRELEEEKLTVQRQVEKKESEINDINTKLNEKNAEIQGLKSDKQALEQQIAEYKTMGETINSKNSLIEKLQQQINEQKQFGLSEQNRLKDEIEGLKHRLTSQGSQSTNNESVIVANERFAPRFANNQTTRSMASLFQNPSDQSNNGSKQMRPEIVPVGVDISGKSLNVLGGNSSNNGSVESLAGSNVPAPPLNNDTRGAQQQAVNPIESAQAAPRVPRLGEQGGIADRNVPEGGARVAGSNNRDLQPIQDIDEMDEGEIFEDRPARNPAEEPAMRNNNPSENAMRAPANRGGLEENERFQPRLEEEGALGNRNRLSGRRKSLRRDRLLDNAAQAEQFGQEVPRRGLS